MPFYSDSHPSLSNTLGNVEVEVDRNSLRSQTTCILRNHIVAGKIPPGTKLVEREIAELLGISRAPTRDALLDLEKEGLVVTKTNGRHVIELQERDIRELYEVRLVLETLAVQLAAEHTSPYNQTGLLNALAIMRECVKNKDAAAYIQSDIGVHQEIWDQADNRHLLRMLYAMSGPIFMFVANVADVIELDGDLTLHIDLVTHINTGEPALAVKSLIRHMDNSLQRAIETFQPNK